MIGMLEYWNNAILEYSEFLFYNIPSFHYSRDDNVFMNNL